MQTRSSSSISNPSSNPTPSTNPNPKGRNRRRSKQRIEEFNLDELSPPIVMMSDQRTMAQLLQAYEDAIIVPAITVDNVELKHGLLTLIQNKKFFRHDKEDPHAQIRYFNKITSTLKFLNVLNTSIKLMLFLFSLERAAQIWLKKEPPRSIFTWDDIRFDESFSEAWDTFKDLLRACPHHGFLELHQLDTFYNALNSKDQDSLNFALVPVVAKVSTNISTFGISLDVAELKDMVKALLLDKKSQNQAPVTVKAVEEFASTSSLGTLPSNTIANPRSDLKGITTQSGVSYDVPQIPPPTSFLPKVVENEPEATKDTVHPTNNGSTEYIQPSVVQFESLIFTSEPVNYPIIEPSLVNLNFNISFADALILMPKFGPSIKSLLTNKDKLCELARTPLNEHCSLVLLKKMPEKLGDPEKFLIPCDFPGMAECLALADLGTSINLMSLSVWNKLSLPDLSPMCMTLELADHFDADPRVPLILEISFLKTGRALINVFKGELTLRVGKEAITFNLNQTSRYSANYNDMMAKQIDAIDMACEEYSQEVLGFSDVIASGNPTPYYDPIISTTSSTLTSFRNNDFLLEEVDAFLALEDDLTSPEVDQSYLDSEGDILGLEAFLNDDPSLPPLNQGNYLPEVRKELKICEAKSDKSSFDEPLEVELKDLPPHLEYTFWKATLKVLQLLDAGLIYPISDSPWVSLVHCVLEKGGFTVVENEDNELIPTRLVTGWRVCIDYRKLNEATRKDHFPLPFMDQMLERLAGNQYYCFLDGFSGYFQIPIDPKDQEKTILTCAYGTFAYRRMPFGLCNAPGTFQSCLSYLEKMLKRCEDTNLFLNWEKSHFMVKVGIVLDHKISKEGIKVDKAKVDVITKLPHPTTIKGIQSFLGHAGFYRRFIKDFSKIARPMTRLLEKDTPFLFSKECVEAFQTLKRKLAEAPILIAPDWDMPFKLMCDASDFAIGAVLRQR
uniref:Reverse transcriptase domain-containing protein n=1 Tax=Tanacetum cinerariifolium TaxID=118510 RepID=A0A6L2J0G2_TANCI|nr:reverse transcriptase domain-containing protein [Tanacetum cinerariifolium]